MNLPPEHAWRGLLTMLRSDTTKAWQERWARMNRHARRQARPCTVIQVEGFDPSDGERMIVTRIPKTPGGKTMLVEFHFRNRQADHGRRKHVNLPPKGARVLEFRLPGEQADHPDVRIEVGVRDELVTVVVTSWVQVTLPVRQARELARLLLAAADEAAGVVDAEQS